MAYRVRTMSEVFEVTPSEGSSADEPDSEPDSNGLPAPIEYLVSIAASHQIVMLGDCRGVAEHLSMLRDSIGPLHAAGITNLAWEFTNTRRQGDLDELTRAPSWDRRRAIELFVDLLGVGHGYEDYLAVIEAVWWHNTNLENGVSPFRIVALGLPTYVEDPDLLDGRSAGETGLRNWWMGGHYRDVSAWHMANIITTEVLRAGERAVVYADASRTNTRFVEWIDETVSLGPGNLLHNWMSEGVARVIFHGALDDDEALARIEQLVAASPDPESAFGLDLETSTLGGVRLLQVNGSTGLERRRVDLSDVADGYLFVMPRSSWTPASLIPDFLDPTTIDLAEQRYRALDPRDSRYGLDELEAVRAEGRASLDERWPAAPDQPVVETTTAKRRFRKKGR